MSDVAALTPIKPDDVIWSGRPTLGVLPQDVWAGLVTLGVCWGVLGLGLVGWFGATPRDGFQLAGVSATVLAAIVTVARALGANARTHGALAGFLAVTALAGLREGAMAQVSGSLVGLLLVGAWLRSRARQRGRTRYHVTRDQVAIGEQGHYEIRFRYDAPPRVIGDPFGQDLADLTFQPHDAQLTTREGKVFKLPVRRLRLYRVRHPQRLLTAIAEEPR